MTFRVRGVIVPLVTPFDGFGRIDARATKRLIHFLIDCGVHGLFPGGTTGEGPLLTTQERQRLAELVVEYAGGRVPVIVHTGAASTAEVITLTEHAREIGAQAVAIVPPFYYSHTDEALFRHFEKVTNQVPDLPVYLYNNPWVACNHLSAELVANLVEHCPSIVGLKDSSGKLDLLSACLSLKDGCFNTASGPDELVLDALILGCDACVSGNANVVPELVVGLFEAAIAGNLGQARKLQQTLTAALHLMGDGRDLSLFKSMLARRGLSVGTVREPLLQASESSSIECWRQLERLGIPLHPVGD